MLLYKKRNCLLNFPPRNCHENSCILGINRFLNCEIENRFTKLHILCRTTKIIKILFGNCYYTKLFSNTANITHVCRTSYRAVYQNVHITVHKKQI